MKFALFGSLAVATASAQVFDLNDASVDVHVRFAAFERQFGKEYASLDERMTALKAFQVNDAKVQDINGQNLTYTLGHNEFSDMLPEDFNAMYIGSYLDNPNLYREKNYDTSLLEVDADTLPESVDWSTKNAVTPIKNQGQCGSCWAFSAVMAIEGDYAIDTGDLLSFSEQDLVSCDTKSNQGCNGGLMDDAFKFVEKNGICLEKDYPYSSGSGTTGTCHHKCTPVATITGYTDVPAMKPAALQAAVAQQPVSVAIEADKSVFQLYSSGVLTGNCGTTLDHGVGIVGYGALDGTDYWKVKNSWGSSWGLEGYVLIERGVNKCGISQSASYPTGAKKM